MKLQLKDTNTPQEVTGKLEDLVGEVIYYGSLEHHDFFLITRVALEEYVFINLPSGHSLVKGRFKGNQNIPKGYYYARKAVLDVER